MYVSISATLLSGRSKTGQLDIRTRAILTKWQNVPQATSYQDWKLLNQLVGAELTPILTILPPPADFLDTVHKLRVNFV
jgi:hypothetical protein